MRRHTNQAVQPQKMYVGSAENVLCCENKVADDLTAELLSSCSELFWHTQSRFPHDVAQMHHVQIRD